MPAAQFKNGSRSGGARRRRLDLGRSATALVCVVWLSAACVEGPPGDPGESGVHPSISAVTPSTVFRDREVVVGISGDDTDWSSDVAVDFGDGIELVQLEVSSPTALRATLVVHANASLGARDVTVTTGEEVLTYAAAFQVDAAVFSAPIDELPQGGIARVSLTMADASTPFDLTADGTGFAHLDASGDDLGFVVENASLFQLNGLVLVDALAPAGSRALTIESGGIESTLDQPIDVVAREADALSDGATRSLAAWDTALYRYDPPTSPTLVTIDVTSDAQGTAPAFALLPKSGAFADLIDFDDSTSFVTDGSGDAYYLVVFDNSGAGDYPFVLGVDEQAAPADLEAEVNDSCTSATALDASAPMLAALAGPTDVDFFELTAGAENVGQVVHVVTLPGDPTTDTIVEVLAADCTTSMGGPSFDGGYHEDHRSTPVAAAGPVFVKVTRSSFGSEGTAYVLTAGFEAP